MFVSAINTGFEPADFIAAFALDRAAGKLRVTLPAPLRPGEAARLLDKSVTWVQGHRPLAARILARRAGGVCVECGDQLRAALHGGPVRRPPGAVPRDAVIHPFAVT